MRICVTNFVLFVPFAFLILASLNYIVLEAKKVMMASSCRVLLKISIVSATQHYCVKVMSSVCICFFPDLHHTAGAGQKGSSSYLITVVGRRSSASGGFKVSHKTAAAV